MANVLCVDVGVSRCKFGLVDWTAGLISQQSAVPSAPFFESNGFSNFCRHLESLALRPGRPEAMALAVPFAVEYTRGSVASWWRAGWPDSIDGILTALDDQLELAALVLNDAVAFALGCPAVEQESGPGTILCLTLGTNFGCAVLHRSGVVEPREINGLLPEVSWPNGFHGSPSMLLHQFTQQGAGTAPSYGALVGWLLGALQPQLGQSPVILGGGRANHMVERELLDGIKAIGGDAVRLLFEPADSVTLFGAARFWHEVSVVRRPPWELVRPGR